MPCLFYARRFISFTPLAGQSLLLHSFISSIVSRLSFLPLTDCAYSALVYIADFASQTALSLQPHFPLLLYVPVASQQIYLPFISRYVSCHRPHFLVFISDISFVSLPSFVARLFHSSQLDAFLFALPFALFFQFYIAFFSPHAGLHSQPHHQKNHSSHLPNTSRHIPRQQHAIALVLSGLHFFNAVPAFQPPHYPPPAPSQCKQ